MSKIRFRGREVKLPKSRFLRMTIGVLLIMGGFLAFLPVFALWMIPLGLVVLSIDLPTVRRYRRRLEVRIGRWWKTAVNRQNGTAGTDSD